MVWADSFTDGFASETGRAAVAVLEAAGLRVGVVTQPACCGLTWVSTGQLTAARRILGHTLDVLHPYVAAGIPVVGLEPSCLATLRSDAVELTADPRAAEIAAGVRSLAEVLSGVPGWGHPTSPVRRSWCSRTATTRASWAGTPTPPCSPAPGPR